jgi:hypothetical protein
MSTVRRFVSSQACRDTVTRVTPLICSRLPLKRWAFRSLARTGALWNLVGWTARRMVAGETPPVEGARWIWFEASDRVQEQGDLRVFIGLASAWDDYFEGRPAIEQHIVEAAAELNRERRRSDVGARPGSFRSTLRRCP